MFLEGLAFTWVLWDRIAVRFQLSGTPKRVQEEELVVNLAKSGSSGLLELASWLAGLLVLLQGAGSY